MLRAIASSPVNILLLAAPISWLLATTSPESPWVFMTAAASLICTKPLRTANTVASVRDVTPILPKILRRWTLTVLMLIFSWYAICWFVAPVATNRRISRSRSLICELSLDIGSDVVCRSVADHNMTTGR